MFPPILKQEFQVSLFGLDHERPAQFYLCQWQRRQTVHPVYVVYRWLFAGYFLSSLVASVMEDGATVAISVGYRAKWPIYLTNWGCLMNNLQAWLAVAIVTVKYLRQRGREYQEPEKTRMPRVYQAYWLINSVATSLAFGITISYWVAVYDPAVDRVSAVMVMGHAVNSALMLADLLLVGHPLRLLHFHWAVSFICIYLAFNATYYAAGGLDRKNLHFIYSILDWQKPQRTTVTCVLIAVFGASMHVTAWLVYLVRRCLHGRWRHHFDVKPQPRSNSVASIRLDVAGF